MTRKWCLTGVIAAGVMAQAATAQATASYQPGPKAKHGPKALPDFARWDRNGDGVIDEAEFQQAVKKVRRFAERERGHRGPDARQGRRGPEARGRGHRGPKARGERHGPDARRGPGPSGKMLERIEAVVRRTVKQTLRDMHEAHGSRHGERGAFHSFGPGEPMRGPRHGAVHGEKRHGPHRGRGLAGPPHHKGAGESRHHAWGFGGGPCDGQAKGPMHGGPPMRGGPAMRGGPPMRGGPMMRGGPACECQRGGPDRQKGAFRDGPKRGRGGEGCGEFRKRGRRGGDGRGEFRKPGRRGARGAGPEAGQRGRRGDRPPPRLMEMFKRQDVNGDGVVTADEFMGPPQRFEMLDANGDGAVDRKELKKAMKRHGKKGRGDKNRRDRKPRDNGNV